MRATVLFPLVLLAGCSVSSDPQADASASASAEPSAVPAPPAAPSVPAQTPVAARNVTVENDEYEFTYSYPAEAGAIPALKGLLDEDLEKQRKELIADAKEGKADATKNGYPYHAYSHSVEWQVVTDTPAWLSMSTLIGYFSGGAHPNYGYEPLLWDKIAGVRRAPTDLFTSKAALAAAIRDPFCKELEKERAKKRGGEKWTGDISEFTKCIDPIEQTVILGSSNGKAFNRIGVLISPYAAGPYAEGSYEVTLPVTPKVLAAVRPEYKPAFVAQ
ncbi:hypothetical protein GGQ88_002659 [Novosphingobium hassiacum]|uniref:Deacetylase PdaC domain-containing protein n=1 Tax=Novosphingobium hassiacum TaxID=173676 RepID=A0A7W6A166_9SPHN|nr:DUF4163 domain-containing protein [Novosphingobium hassiacum]MBB3861375.1 hypothetical protein [Novosphingobium hassiacum]